MNAITQLDVLDLEHTIARYGIGELVRYRPAANGIENSNYFLRTLFNGREREFVLTVLEQPSNAGAAFVPLLDLCECAGLPVPDAILARDVSRPWVADAALEAAWAIVYRDPETHWALYELAEKLVDFEDYFRRWRFNHVTTVERVIGLKRGTGGTSGVAYLKRMLEIRLFPELWDLRTTL